MKVCAGEGKLAFHTVAHHNSFKSMDCTSKLLREMFSDSEVANLKNIIKPSLICVGCPAHVLNNCIQQGTDTLEIDIESIVLKVYSYF
jgi:hypothetical protein